MPEEAEHGTPTGEHEESMLDDEHRTVGPRRNPPEEMSEEPLGTLPGEKPSYDTGGAQRPMPPEVPDAAQQDESETLGP